MRPGAAQTARPAAPAVNHRYRVTVTNVTKGQIFAPTLIVAHDRYEFVEAVDLGRLAFVSRPPEQKRHQ